PSQFRVLAPAAYVSPEESVRISLPSISNMRTVTACASGRLKRIAVVDVVESANGFGVFCSTAKPLLDPAPDTSSIERDELDAWSLMTTLESSKSAGTCEATLNSRYPRTSPS